MDSEHTIYARQAVSDLFSSMPMGIGQIVATPDVVTRQRKNAYARSFAKTRQRSPEEMERQRRTSRERYDRVKQDPRRSEKYMLNHRLKRFELDYAGYHRLLRKQNGVCAICKQPETWKSRTPGKPMELSIDHCHKTNRVRALLCHACNTAIAHLGEDPSRLRAAATYLENFS